MEKQIFPITIFECEVDIDKLGIPLDGETLPTWDSGVPTSFSRQLDVKPETWEYLSGIINNELYHGQLMGHNPKFGHMWYNKYEIHHYQDPHIHPNCQWSFIIYVDLNSKTSFLNPSMMNIQNQLGNNLEKFPLDYKPELGPGNMIIFPSFMMHLVNAGNVGHTISGNIYMEYH